jgi:caa(3)-type oxidase subunit IV
VTETHHAEPGAAHDPAGVDRHVRAALLVFGSLLVLTGFTVAAWMLHLETRSAIALALLIALVKGSLVACWFMHLISEKRFIYWVLALTAVLFFPLLLFPVLTSGAVHLR